MENISDGLRRARSRVEMYRKNQVEYQEAAGKLLYHTNIRNNVIDEIKHKEKKINKLSGNNIMNKLHRIFVNDDIVVEEYEKELYELRSNLVRLDKEVLHWDKRVDELSHSSDEVDEAVSAYSRFLREKEDYIKKNSPDVYKMIENLHEQDNEIGDRIRSLYDLLGKAEDALISIINAKKYLESASGWGTVDMLGGGTVTTAIKRGKMREAERWIDEMTKKIKILSSYAKDVSIDTGNIDLGLGSFLGAADYMFDCLFVDWGVQKKINHALDTVSDNERKVEQLINKTDRAIKQLQARSGNITKEIEEIIYDA